MGSEAVATGREEFGGDEERRGGEKEGEVGHGNLSWTGPDDPADAVTMAGATGAR